MANLMVRAMMELRWQQCYMHYIFSSCSRNMLLDYSSALMENSSDSSVVQRLQLRQ